jgi:hypothetical protein
VRRSFPEALSGGAESNPLAFLLERVDDAGLGLASRTGRVGGRGAQERSESDSIAVSPMRVAIEQATERMASSDNGATKSLRLRRQEDQG